MVWKQLKTSKGSMGFRCSYYITERAERDFDDITGYLIEAGGYEIAARFVGEYEKQIENIRMFPEMGSVVDNMFVTLEDVRWIKVLRYRLYYHYSNGKVTVLRIVHEKQNMMEYGIGI